MKPVDNAHPGIYALDLMSGDLVWEKHIQHQYKGETYNSLFSSALSVTNDVLLAANLNGVLKAFRTSDGQELWSFDTAIKVTDANGVVGNGGTVDSVGPVPAGKDVYLNSGYSTFGGTNPWQAGPGNAFFVFRLPWSGYSHQLRGFTTKNTGMADAGHIGQRPQTCRSICWTRTAG